MKWQKWNGRNIGFQHEKNPTRTPKNHHRIQSINAHDTPVCRCEYCLGDLTLTRSAAQPWVQGVLLRGDEGGMQGCWMGWHDLRKLPKTAQIRISARKLVPNRKAISRYETPWTSRGLRRFAIIVRTRGPLRSSASTILCSFHPPVFIRMVECCSHFGHGAVFAQQYFISMSHSSSPSFPLKERMKRRIVQISCNY